MARLTLTSTVTLMEGITLMEKARTARLVIGSEINEELEMGLIDVSHEFRRRVAKVEFADAVLAVGLAHLEEVKARLQEGQAGDD